MKTLYFMLKAFSLYYFPPMFMGGGLGFFLGLFVFNSMSMAFVTMSTCSLFSVFLKYGERNWEEKV